MLIFSVLFLTIVLRTSMSAVTRAAPGLNFGRIISQTNFSCQILNLSHAKVFAPGGFTNEAFNGNAYVQPWSLLKMIEGTRSAVFKESKDGESFVDVERLYKNYLLFIASTSTTVSPDLYRISTVKAPLEFDVKLNFVGNTSFKLRTSIYAQSRSLPLYENDTQTVCVNIETRRPSSLPDWWREKYSAVKGEPLKPSRLNIPENVESRYNRQVQPSDVDTYMHLNWSNYIKFCHDAFVCSEIKKNGMDKATEAFRNMKQFSISFIREAAVGDSINVRLWQNSTNRDAYHFQLLRSSDVIGECSIEYFT